MNLKPGGNLFFYAILSVLLLGGCAGTVADLHEIRAWEAYNQGAAAEEKGNLQQARKDYTRALAFVIMTAEQRPSSLAQMRLARGKVNALMCQSTEAIKDFDVAEEQAAKAQNPAYAAVSNMHKGWFYYDLGNYTQAADAYRKGLARAVELEEKGGDPNNPDPMVLAASLDEYAHALKATGQNAEAERVGNLSANIKARNPGKSANYTRPSYKKCR